MRPILFVFVSVVVCGFVHAVVDPSSPFYGSRGSGVAPSPSGADPSHPSTEDCIEKFFDQPYDHFSTANIVNFSQRYFICYPNGKPTNPNTPVFFYTGNESDVELYVNHTGLMWENAKRFGAILVFAEHRYFGKSILYNTAFPSVSQMQFLTPLQALADYSSLIYFLREEDQNLGAFVGFGGSYGGMLCAWMRIKYPFALAGCVAGSAPVFQMEGMEKYFDVDGFSKTVTSDAVPNFNLDSKKCQQQLFRVFQNLTKTTGSMADTLLSFLGVCPHRGITLLVIVGALFEAVSNMAMGSYPYPSSYMMLGSARKWPAYPLRQFCASIPLGEDLPLEDVLEGLGHAIKEFMFPPKDASHCLDPSNNSPNIQRINLLWGYLACTTMVMPMSSRGNLTSGGDMFFWQPWDPNGMALMCASQGMTTNLKWNAETFGGIDLVSGASNIFFSQGELDPWAAGGFNPAVAPTHPSIKTSKILNAGHHLDLFFSNPKDILTTVRETRRLEMKEVEKWIAEYNINSAKKAS